MLFKKELTEACPLFYTLDMELLSVVEAAAKKGCTVQAIRDAIAKDKIKGQHVGRSLVVMGNRKFDEWEPNSKRQAGAKAGWKSRS